MSIELLSGGSGSNIKSIQRGIATISDSNGMSRIVNINQIDRTRSLLLYSYKPDSNNNNIRYHFVGGQITSDTTLNFKRGGAFVYTIDIQWQVIEFNNVKSIQSGTLSDSEMNNKANINPVKLEKSIIITNGFYSAWSSATNNNYFSQMKNYIDFNSPTEIQLSNVYDRDRAYYWQIIEFR